MHTLATFAVCARTPKAEVPSVAIARQGGVLYVRLPVRCRQDSVLHRRSAAKLVRASLVGRSGLVWGGACVRDVVVPRAPSPRSAPVSLTPRRVVVRRTFASAAGGGPCGRSSGHPGRSGRFAFWVRVVLPAPPPVSASQGWTARLVCLSGVRTVRRVTQFVCTSRVGVCSVARQRLRPGREFSFSSQV